MNITFGNESISEILIGWANQGPFVFLLNVFINGGWFPFLLLMGFLWYTLWLQNKQGKYIASYNRIFLAIDVPKLNEQTPKAVEQIFAHMAGAHRNPTKWQQYYEGYIQPWFTFEIISIEGYIQFLISTPERLRDLVEAAVYSQYPDAEITQVDDYAKPFNPKTFFQTHDLWGSELVLKQNQAFPIRTYPHYEHPLTGDFLDPLGSMMEIMGRMGRGEQLWIQIGVQPNDGSWKNTSLKLAQKLIGKKAPKIPTITGGVVGAVRDTLQESMNQIGGRVTADKSAKKDDLPSMMLHLSPGERSGVEAVELKASKTGFNTKVRMIYLAHKEVYLKNKGKGVEGVMGAFRTFDDLTSNGFGLGKYTKTVANYFFIQYRLHQRKLKLLRNYRTRSMWVGGKFQVMNTEELATIYHFPNETVRAPLLKRTEAKRGEPPFGIPLTDMEEPLPMPSQAPSEEKTKEAGTKEIPIVD